MMTLEELKEHVDLYSADLSRWPEAKVKPALDLTSENKEAREYFDAALKLDDVLRGYVPKQSALSALEARIMAEIAKAPPVAAVPEVRIRKAWIFAPGGGLLAAAILGFIIGILPVQQSSDTLVDPVYYNQDQIIGADSDNDTGGLF